jgi:hypothetical protein
VRGLSIVALATVATISLAQGQYFPNSSFSSSGDEFKSHWYSSQLHALREPSLFVLTKTPSSECYRFLWLRTFNHPIAIRLDPKSDGTGILTVKVASGAGGFHPGAVSESRTRVLTREETQSFLLQLDRLGFWKLPSTANDQMGSDGSQWIIEGVKGRRYHVVDRWSPTKGPVHELGMIFAFDLAKMNIPEKEIY